VCLEITNPLSKKGNFIFVDVDITMLIFNSSSTFPLSSQNAIGSSHPVMHNIVGNHVKEYIKETPEMRKFFERLMNANKKLFLVTNSPFHFV
jgi:hypothetical protein